MKKALVIFTGINYSHFIVDKAFDWAAKQGAPLQVVFLESKKEKREGYGFPSDYQQAEKLTNREDAKKDDVAILRDYEKVLKDLGSEKSVAVSTKILTDPSIEQILSLTKDAAMVFADASYDPNDPLSPKGFTQDKLKRDSFAPVMILEEE